MAPMPPTSAGLLVWRPGGARRVPEVLLVHPGGPYWARRDDGWWSIPKGEVGPGEDELAAAEREFAEELGVPPPPGPRVPLGEVRQAGGKRVAAWAVAGDLDVSNISGGSVELEWPPRSGVVRAFPEVDRAAWYDLDTAHAKLLAGQVPFLERLAAATGAGPTRRRRT